MSISMCTSVHTLSPISTQERSQTVNRPVSISKSIVHPEYSGYVYTRKKVGFRVETSLNYNVIIMIYSHWSIHRDVPYHHWEHGFNVAHAIWRIIKTNDSLFTLMEKKALMIASICHDIDHRGYNNEFFVKLNLPLASLYSTSVMEQHHYKQSVMILQVEFRDHPFNLRGGL